MELVEEHVAEDPVHQFDRWRRDAHELGELQPDAMTLATADKDGRPSARLVILRCVDDRGFVFYTNYNSRKGRELAEKPSLLLAEVRAAGQG